MFRLVTVLFIVALIAALPVHAQESLPTPLRAEDVLTDSVEVVETLSQWWTDYASLYHYDEATGAWQTYALPQTAQIQPIVTPQGDGVYQVTLCYPDVFGVYPNTGDCNWQLDTTTGEFTVVTAVCGYFALYESGEWVSYFDEATEQLHFCNVNTGELSTALPISYQNVGPTGVPFSSYVVSDIAGDTNPAGNLVILSLGSDLQAFDLQNGAMTPLGVTEAAWLGGVHAEWVNDTQVVFAIVTTTGQPRQFDLYVADATQANSATIIHSGETMTLPTNDAQPRAYQWLESDCTFYELAFDTLEISSYTIPGVCSRGVPIEDGSGDWVTFQDHQVLRYSPAARSVRVLYMDGIDCYDVNQSPDGAYQQLTLSVNGHCDELAVLDLQNGGLVYTTPYGDSRGQTLWVDGDTLLIYGTTNGADRLVHLDTGEEVYVPHVFIPFASVTNPISRDGRWLLVQNDDDSLAVLDMTTGEVNLIARGIGNYGVQTVWEEDGTLRIQLLSVADSGTGMRDGYRMGGWRVRVGA